VFTFKVDGDVYAQPLYVSGVDVPGKGKHNVLFVATENDSVYAFDGDGAPRTPLWQVSLANSSDGGRPLSERDVSCFFISPKVGITSTPVIDLKTGTLYVLARTKERTGLFTADAYKQRLHALAITTGMEKFGGPVEVKASVKGTGAGHSGGQVAFDPQTENPRAALLLANNSVYLSWGSSCDIVPYHGWLMAYDPTILTQKSVFNTSPDASDSAIWQGDAGPAADKEGNVFVARCSFHESPPDWWRPGMTGVAKLDAGESSLLWILTHRLIDTLRLKLDFADDAWLIDATRAFLEICSASNA